MMLVETEVNFATKFTDGFSGDGIIIILLIGELVTNIVNLSDEYCEFKWGTLWT